MKKCFPIIKYFSLFICKSFHYAAAATKQANTRIEFKKRTKISSQHRFDKVVIKLNNYGVRVLELKKEQNVIARSFNKRMRRNTKR